MCLREGPHDNNVGVGLDERDRGAHAGFGRKIDVGLVDDDHDVVGGICDEGGDLLVGEGGAGRVVGRTEDERDSVVRDGLAHGDEVVATIREEWHRIGVGPHRRDGDRVGLEGAPREDDLGARLAHGGQRSDEDRRGAGADAHLIRTHAEAVPEGFAQGRGGQVGVAVDRLELAGDRFQHGRAGRGRHLVGRDFDGVGRGLAGLVAR